jgi:hypothetical protein
VFDVVPSPAPGSTAHALHRARHPPHARTHAQGFGTVRFTNPDAALKAIANFHERELEGRRLAVFLDKYA